MKKIKSIYFLKLFFPKSCLMTIVTNKLVGEKDNNEILSFRMKINGNYYCFGSRNFEGINISLDSYKIISYFFNIQ